MFGDRLCGIGALRRYPDKMQRQSADQETADKAVCQVGFKEFGHVIIL
jgi:hypothetical protein